MLALSIITRNGYKGSNKPALGHYPVWSISVHPYRNRLVMQNSVELVRED